MSSSKKICREFKLPFIIELEKKLEETNLYIDKLKKENENLTQEIKEYTQEYAYRPDGEIAKALKEHYNDATKNL